MTHTQYMIGSPLGMLHLTFTCRGLRSISLIDDGRDLGCFSGLYDDESDDRLVAVKTYINDHFFCRDPGRRGIELDMDGMSDFRKRVYEELVKVPFGEVLTYGELALRIGRPGGGRAIGQAMNKNPFLILVPCHRVVASDGKGGFKIGGFGAGMDAKRVLLRLEGHDENMISGL